MKSNAIVIYVEFIILVSPMATGISHSQITYFVISVLCILPIRVQTPGAGLAPHTNQWGLDHLGLFM